MAVGGNYIGRIKEYDGLAVSTVNGDPSNFQSFEAKAIELQGWNDV